MPSIRSALKNISLCVTLFVSVCMWFIVLCVWSLGPPASAVTVKHHQYGAVCSFELTSWPLNTCYTTRRQVSHRVSTALSSLAHGSALHSSYLPALCSVLSIHPTRTHPQSRAQTFQGECAQNNIFFYFHNS